MLSKYFSGRRLILSSTSARSANTVSWTTRLSTSACSHLKMLRQHVEREHQQQHSLERAEVDALARVEVHAGQQVGALVVALGAQPRR